MKKIKEYVKTKKGMVTIAVVTLLIIVSVALVSIWVKRKNKDDLRGNTVENMDDAELTVSDDPEGPKEEDGSTDFSKFLEEEGEDFSSDDQKDDGQESDDSKSDDSKDDDQKDGDLEDVKDQIPGGQWGPLY